MRLYHCDNSRSFRALWALEEVGAAYELISLSFPPRETSPDYLGINPLGTVPFLVDGETRMTESAAICQYLADRHSGARLNVAVDAPRYGDYLNALHYGEATLTVPQGHLSSLRALRTGGAAQRTSLGRLSGLIPRSALLAGCHACARPLCCRG